jgi:hypothetical protein
MIRAPISGSPEVHPDYKSAVEERAPGLDNHAINVFSSTQQKLKPLTDAFCWGESYYFVWQSKAPFAFPPGLISHALAENRGWSCALAILPHAPDAELATWLTTNCNLSIIRAKREWAIVYPPLYAFDDNGSLEITVPFISCELTLRPSHRCNRSFMAGSCRTG